MIVQKVLIAPNRRPKIHAQPILPDACAIFSTSSSAASESKSRSSPLIPMSLHIPHQISSNFYIAFSVMYTRCRVLRIAKNASLLRCLAHQDRSIKHHLITHFHALPVALRVNLARERRYRLFQIVPAHRRRFCVRRC